METKKYSGLVFRSGENGIILRPVLKEDLERIVLWMNNPEVTQFLSMTFPQGEIAEEKWIEKKSIGSTSDIVLAIEVEGKHIGNIGLHQINWPWRTATLGIAIGDKEYWGKGYGKKAIDTLLNYAFNDLDLRKVGLDVYGHNVRAQKCYKKNGFKEIGRKRDHFFKNGTYGDVIMMEVFAEEWRALQEK